MKITIVLLVAIALTALLLTTTSMTELALGQRGDTCPDLDPGCSGDPTGGGGSGGGSAFCGPDDPEAFCRSGGSGSGSGDLQCGGSSGGGFGFGRGLGSGHFGGGDTSCN
jgi:hypothetical protein